MIQISKTFPIGIGTWGIGGFMKPEYGDEEKDEEAIRYSISKGQNHIDTAEMYGNGHSEEIVGQAIKGIKREKLFIASKVHRNYTKGNEVLKSTEKILKRLKTDYLDLLYIHSYWQDENMEDYLKGVNQAVDRGMAKAIGVSNFSIDNLKWAVNKSKHPIVANQMNYNVLHQIEVPEDMKTFCRKEKICVVAYRPIERKLLADECVNETVLEIAEKYGKSPAQIAINWLVSQPQTFAIPKSTNKTHIDENLQSLSFKIEEKDIELLNNLII
jgi:diketogulonate reductase-like aldo/keto reductase